MPREKDSLKLEIPGVLIGIATGPVPIVVLAFLWVFFGWILLAE
jgi:hypothetical protein